MVAIETAQLTKTYRPGSPALCDVSLAAPAGEILAVLGPSGSGKTTLLRLLAGLELPDGGAVRLHGESAAELPAWQRGVGLVFQEGGLPGDWSAGQCLAFAARGLPQAAERVASVAAQANISELLSSLIRGLSGGQRRRVALARAMVRQPKILLLDEPLSSLDPASRQAVREQIARAAETAAVVLVTHDPLDALTLGRRIAVLDRGSLLQIGPAAEVYNQPVSRTVAALLRPLGLNAFSGDFLALDWSGGGSDWAANARQPGAELLIPVAELREEAGDFGGLRCAVSVKVEQVSPWEGRQLVRASVAQGDSRQEISFIAAAERQFAPVEVVRLGASRWFWADGPSGRVRGEKMP